MKKNSELSIKLDKRSLYLRSLVVECLFGGGRGHGASPLFTYKLFKNVLTFQPQFEKVGSHVCAVVEAKG